MTLEERIAQLGSVWPGADAPDEAAGGAVENVAPMQDVFARRLAFADAVRDGVGHLTRHFGSGPVEPTAGAESLVEVQATIVAASRLGVPAIVHEECLTGFTTYRASVFPASLAWAATFDPVLVERMARAIGDGMRAVGVHQGLSPVLDVVRDHRWGRVEETLGEDPHLVAVLGTAYVRGLQAAGVLATLKHFAGYSASRAARNHAPVSIGRRELEDVILPSFRMAVRDGGARSVMNSYADVDGVPAGADAGLLTGILRDRWGFEGTVVSDYWSVPFLETMHRVAASPGAAGALALAAGVDVELPDTQCFGGALLELVRSGEVPAELVDRAARRVLRQKVELGLLDADWTPGSGTAAGAGGQDKSRSAVDLDPPANRAIARELAERSIVLLENAGGLLPLAAETTIIALVGPCVDDPQAFFGCYSFPNHVLPRHPSLPMGVVAPSLLDALRAELPDAAITWNTGCPVSDPDRTGLRAAVAAAERADVCIAMVGDRSGLFGRGTSGEGCDAADLALPGVQGELVEALLATATPVVLLVVSGRPYALGSYRGRAAALVQSFFPGEEGGPALAGVLSGRVVPSGKLPVQVASVPGGQPGTYLHPPLGGNTAGISNLDPSPAYPFGHGISYTTFGYSELDVDAAEIPTKGTVVVSCVVTNTGSRDGAEIVQLYLGDPVAQVTRPDTQLAGFVRVPLTAGARARVSFWVHADRTAFTGIDLRPVVEPGRIDVVVGSSSADVRLRTHVTLTGPVRSPGADQVLTTPVEVQAVP